MRKKKKVNANETYMQTVMRRFRAHHLAKISLVILVVVGLAALFAPVVAPYDRMRSSELSAVHRVRNLSLERIRSAGMCSADFYTQPEFLCL